MKVPKKRGFAILIILAVIATTSVVLATQLASVESQSMVAVRAVEELKARDVAEECLDAADAYIEDYGLENTGRDFDALLDPDDLLTTTADNFLPPATLLGGAALGTASIPPGVSDQFHQYRVFSVAGVGACFVRFDDNSDDSNPLGALAQFTDAGEGTGVDLPQRDRDRTISVTVVGVVPAQASIADLYKKAHSVASITVLRAMPPVISSGAAIEAGGTFYGDGAVCGEAAGVIADAIQGGCVCGAVDAQLISGSLSGSGDCGCPDCAPNSPVNIAPGARPNPVITVPPFSNLLANVAFGAPGSTGNNIAAGTYGIAAVLIRDAESINPASGTAYAAGATPYQAANTADVFAWDTADNDAVTTLGGGGVVAMGAGARDCRDTSAMDPLPRPCRWSPVGNVTPTNLVCTGTESPCWKLVARLGTGNGPIADLDVRGAVARGEHSSSTNPDSSFAPRATPLPNFKGATTWTNLAPASCTTCGGTAIVTMTGNDYNVATTAIASMPHMVLAVETTTAATVSTGGLPSTNFARLSILAQSTVAPGAGSNQCCATCDPGCAFASCSAGPPPAAGSTADKGRGFAIRTSGPCTQVVNNIAMFGVEQCSTIESDGNNQCYVGGWIANASPGTIACPLPGTPNTAFCNAAAGVCMKNNLDLVGDVFAAGNICIKNNFDGVGSIQSQGSVGWKNNGGFVGQVRAAGDVAMKNNNRLTFDGAGGSSDAQGIAASLWIDGSW